jgi:hypothetical protein
VRSGDLVGLLLLFSALVPGYVWTRVAERRTPLANRSALLEAAELLAVGALTTVAAGALVLSISRATSLLDTGALRADAVGYILEHPVRALGALAAVAVCSCALAWAGARLVYRGEPPTLQSGTVWTEILGDRKDRALVATVAMRNGPSSRAWCARTATKGASRV